jgi:hypothetical protein
VNVVNVVNLQKRITLTLENSAKPERREAKMGKAEGG